MSNKMSSGRKSSAYIQGTASESFNDIFTKRKRALHDGEGSGERSGGGGGGGGGKPTSVKFYFPE